MKTTTQDTFKVGDIEFLTTTGFAKLLGVHPITVYRLVTQHKLKVTKYFRKNLFLKSYLDDFLANNTLEVDK
jgi:excisionase family DNA binding protein